MAATTGKEPSVELPKQLQDMLEVFLRDNCVRSWSVYSEHIGSTIKIRLQPVAAMLAVQPQPHRQHVNKTITATGIPAVTPTMHYSRKSPCHVKRDIQRCNKRPRVHSSPESARIDDVSAILGQLDSPESVSCERGEESLVLSPVVPIEIKFTKNDSDELNACKISDGDVLIKPKSVPVDETKIIVRCLCCDEEFADENHTCESDNNMSDTMVSDMNCKVIDGDILIDNKYDSVICRCCDESMIDGNHMCDDAASKSTADTRLKENSKTENSKVSSVFCFITEKKESYAPNAHDSELIRCHGCGRYCCRTCLLKYGLYSKSKWRWYACCQNMSHSTPSHYSLNNVKLKQ